MSLQDFVPQFSPRKPKKLTDENWLSTEEPQVILYQAMRKAGKGVAVDKTAEELYKAGINIWHIWAARSFENLYWAINKNCRDKYIEYKKKVLEEIKRKRPDVDVAKIDFGLHCKCHKAYQILWIVPEYIEFDLESLERFNGCFFRDYNEYSRYYKEISNEDKQKLLDGKLRKPDEICPEPLIKVSYITTPTNQHRKEIFREQFTEIVLQARKEHRIVVMNPAIFEGQLDKFESLTEIMRMIPYLMNKSGYFMPLTEKEVGKPRSQWSKWQKSYHKVAIIINELRSVAPSSQIHGEKDASKSKKAIFDYIPEARHYKTWFCGDYQNPQDLYAGVRYQANMVIIKRASKNLLGVDWSWLFEKVEQDRIGLLRRLPNVKIEKKEDVWRYEKNPKIKRYLDYRRPRVDSLPDNKGYVTHVNGEISLETFDLPSFHHKTSMEDFLADTGIKWTVNMKKKPEESADATKNEIKEIIQKKKVVREELLKKIDYMVQVEKKNFKQVKDEVVLMQDEGIIPDMGYENRSPVYFNNMYLKWKKKPEEQKQA